MMYGEKLFYSSPSSSSSTSRTTKKINEIYNRHGDNKSRSLSPNHRSETINQKTTDITKNTPLDWAYHNDSPNKTDIIDLIRQYGGMHGSEKSRKKANNKARKTKKKKKMYISLPDDEESKNYSKVNEKLSNQSKKINMVREPEEFPAELLPPPGSFLPTPKLPDDVEMEIMT